MGVPGFSITIALCVNVYVCARVCVLPQMEDGAW
jgi:hypothetical protein